MHRIKYTKLTPDQILGKLTAAANGPTSASSFADVFAGTSLKIVLDNGPALSYRFADSRKLSLTEGTAAAVQAGYGALTLPPPPARWDTIANADSSILRQFRGGRQSGFKDRIAAGYGKLLAQQYEIGSLREKRASGERVDAHFGDGTGKLAHRGGQPGGV